MALRLIQRRRRSASAERRKPGLRAAEDQRVHVMRALIRVDRFQVHHVPDHVVLVHDPIATVHVPSDACIIGELEVRNIFLLACWNEMAKFFW